MAIYANLTADQGSNFDAVIDVIDVDGNYINISDYTYRGQVRKSYASSTSVDFTVYTNNPVQGQLIIELSAEQTAAMKYGRYVYDVEIISSSGYVTRVVEGQLEITPRVTRTS